MRMSTMRMVVAVGMVMSRVEHILQLVKRRGAVLSRGVCANQDLVVVPELIARELPVLKSIVHGERDAQVRRSPRRYGGPHK